MGLLMCKSHQVELEQLIDPALKDQETKAQMKKIEYEQSYMNYCKNIGIKKSCHIPREHGPDISLMTEVVFEQTTKPLFATEVTSESEDE